MDGILSPCLATPIPPAHGSHEAVCWGARSLSSAIYLLWWQTDSCSLMTVNSALHWSLQVTRMVLCLKPGQNLYRLISFVPTVHNQWSWLMTVIKEIQFQDICKWSLMLPCSNSNSSEWCLVASVLCCESGEFVGMRQRMAVVSDISLTCISKTWAKQHTKTLQYQRLTAWMFRCTL